MMVVAINQPCYLPWRGFFALMKLADTFVFYDDVQFTSNTARSFFSRVQLKTARGRAWLTVPVQKAGRFGQKINQVGILPDQRWEESHCQRIRDALGAAPHAGTLEPFLGRLAGRPWTRLSELTVHTTLDLASALGIGPKTLVSSEMQIPGAGSQRVLAICRALGATTYLTGHGALNYLDHESFEAAGIAVEYVDYGLAPYPQLHGPFEPYVTVLDLMANTGRVAPAHIQAQTVPWRAMVARRPGT
jgi:hypothetical protein